MLYLYRNYKIHSMFIQLKTKKIGKLEVAHVGDFYNVTQVIKKYNSKFKKNRSYNAFASISEHKLFISDLCRLLNVFYKSKTNNEKSLTQYFKFEEISSFAQRYSHVVLAAKYIVWCFPEFSSECSNLVYQWIYRELKSEKLKTFSSWIYANESTYLTINSHTYSNSFDPLCFLKEICLVKKFLYEDSSNDSIIEDVIELNKSLIEVNVPFEDRVIVISRFFNK